MSLFQKLEDIEEIKRCCNSIPEYSKKCEYLLDKTVKMQIHEDHLNYVLNKIFVTADSFDSIYLIEYLKSLNPQSTDLRPLVELDLQKTILTKKLISRFKYGIDEQHEIEIRKMEERSRGIHLKKIPWSKSRRLLEFLFQLLKEEKLIHKDTEWLIFIAHFCLENEDPYCEVLVSIKWIGSEYKLALMISILKNLGIINSRSFFADCEGHFVNKDGMHIKNFSEKKFNTA